MSKGLGAIERAVLEIVEANRRIDALAITCLVFQADGSAKKLDPSIVTPAQSASVRRALSSLRRKRLIFKLARAYVYGYENKPRELYASRDSALEHIRLSGKAGIADKPDLVWLLADQAGRSARK